MKSTTTGGSCKILAWNNFENYNALTTQMALRLNDLMIVRLLNYCFIIKNLNEIIEMG